MTLISIIYTVLADKDRTNVYILSLIFVVGRNPTENAGKFEVFEIGL